MQTLPQAAAHASTLLAALRTGIPAALPHLTHLLPYPQLLSPPPAAFSTASTPSLPPHALLAPRSLPSHPTPLPPDQRPTPFHPKSFHHSAATHAASSLSAKLQQEELWLNGVDSHVARWASIGTYPTLKDRSKEVTEQVRERFLQLLTAHAAGRLLDDQARRHLKMVCLAVATLQVLEGAEVGVSREHAEELVAMSLGSLLSPFFSAAMKGSVWVKARLLGREPWDLAVQTLRDVGVDMAGACRCDVRGAGEGEAGTVLEVAQCMYQEVLVAEGAQHLLKHFCCGFNMTWFGVYSGYGVQAARTATLAEGQPCCRIELWKE